jgi:DNA repair protein RadB
MADKNKISTGSYDLNKWLYGGYEKGIITMIVGPPGSGKTNFMILSACSQIKKGNKVIFIDTEGGFSSERVKQIIGENYKDFLKDILLLEPTSFEEQEKYISQLSDKMKKEHSNLIIIDGMAMLYRLKLGDALNEKDSNSIKEVNRKIAKQMKNLSEISRKQNISVIITNQVYNSFISKEEWEKGLKKEIHIVGGDLFKYLSKCIIELKNDKGKRKAILLKHRYLENKILNFEIKDKGIFKKRWI